MWCWGGHWPEDRHAPILEYSASFDCFSVRLSMILSQNSQRRRKERSTASSRTWAWPRQSGLMSAIFVIFLRYAESFVRFRAGCWHFVWLQYADNCQQSFSSDAQPSLHTALPAIEELYTKWEQASAKERYSKFKDALTAAMEKLEEYYERTAASDAHIIAMGMLVILLPPIFCLPSFFG